jgi:hypothetical protein
MNNEMVAYIAKRIAEITRRYPSSSISIGVIMPTNAGQSEPNFLVRETETKTATNGEPTTSVYIQ